MGALSDEPMPQHTHVHAVVEAYPHQHSDALRASLQQSLKLGDAFVRPASARVAERSRSGSMHVPVAEIEGMRDACPVNTSGQHVTYFRMQKMRGEAGVWAALPADYKLYYLLPDDDAAQARLTIVVRFCAPSTSLDPSPWSVNARTEESLARESMRTAKSMMHQTSIGRTHCEALSLTQAERHAIAMAYSWHLLSLTWQRR